MLEKKLKNAPRGFTLVEILVALLITSILVTVIYNFFIRQHHAYTVQDQVIEMEQNARAAMDMIRRDLRMAGYHAMGEELLENLDIFVPSNIIPGYPLPVILNNEPIKITQGSGGVSDMITFLTIQPKHNNFATLDQIANVGDTNIILKAGEGAEFTVNDMIHIGACSEYAKVTAISGDELTVEVISENKKLAQEHKMETPVSKISVVSYAVIKDADGTSVLKRWECENKAKNCDQYQPVAENITDMQIDKDGTTGEILITLTSQTDRPDYKFQPNNGYRTYTANARIMARNAGVDGVDVGTDCPLPAAPVITSLTGLDVTRLCEIDIEWSEVTVSEQDCDVTGYKVFYSTSSGGFYDGSVDVDGKVVTKETLDVTGLNACTYYIAVAAVNSAGTGAKSDVEYVTDLLAPEAPTGFSAENINGVERKVLLSWDKNLECDLQGYNIERKLESEIETEIISRELDTFTDIAFGTPVDIDDIDCSTYSYRIQAEDYCLPSSWSTEVSAAPTAPAPPTGPIFSSTDTTDTLSWTLSTDDFDVNGLNYIQEYRVYIPPENSVPVDTLDPGTTTWTSTSLNPYYNVSAFDACGKESDRLVFSSACSGTEPVITIQTPGEGETVTGTVTIQGTATAADVRNISRVRLQIDSSSWVDLSGTEAWSYQWDTTAEEELSHTIAVGAYDDQGCYTQESITVTVSNPEMVINDLQCKLYGSQSTDGYVYLLAYVYDTNETDPISGAAVKADIDVGPSFQELLAVDELGYYGGDATAPFTMETDAGVETDKIGIATRSQQKPKSGTITVMAKKGDKITTCSWENP